MPASLAAYVRIVDAIGYRVGRIVMYLIFAMIGILLWSSISKTFFLPSLWTLEAAQFTMVGYYILGGAYSLQLGANVRMDLLYGSWTVRTKAWVNAFTVLFLIFFLGVFIYGAVESTAYSLEYGERSPTAWRPYLWPIKIVMCLGALLMLLQALAELVRDIATVRGMPLPPGPVPRHEKRIASESMTAAAQPNPLDSANGRSSGGGGGRP